MIEDREAEDAVLGAVLLSDRVLRPLLADGLRPTHFRDVQRQAIFAAMIAIADEGHRPDSVTLAVKTGFDARAIDKLAGAVPNVGNVRAYSRRVIEVAGWRRRHFAASRLIEAVEVENEEMAAQAEAELVARDEASVGSTYTTDQLKALMIDEFILAGQRAEGFPLIFPRMTSTARLRRGQMMLIGGWTSHGKTVVLDQILERCHTAKHKVHLYLNEMTPQERVMRTLARRTGIWTDALERGELSAAQQRQVSEELDDLPFGITDAAGWSASDIARHMQFQKADVYGLDILHLIEYEDEAGLRSISRTLNQATKPSQANCALIATVHLNDARATAATLPQPTGRDIKGASALRQDTDKLLFVHREQDTKGTPSNEALLYLQKNRQGKLGAWPAYFNDDRMRFEVAP